MSKKQGRQKKSFPWPVVILGGILLIVAVFFFTNQSSDSNNSGGTPVIAVDQQKIDYGYVPFGNNKTFTIKVTNTGSGTLSFADKPYIEVLEGC